MLTAWGTAVASGVLLHLDPRDATHDPDWQLGYLWLGCIVGAIAVSALCVIVHVLPNDYRLRFGLRNLMTTLTIVALLLGLVVLVR
jgi:hypothetical protein